MYTSFPSRWTCLGACRACQATIGRYRYPELAGAFEAVDDLDVPSDGPDLGKPEPVVLPDESAVQLVSLGLLCPEDTLDHTPLSVLVLVEQPGRFFPAGLAPVDGVLSLLYVGNKTHLEEHLAVLVGIVSLVPIKEVSTEIKPLTLHHFKHDRQHGGVVDVASGGKRGQYDLQAQDGSYQ